MVCSENMNERIALRHRFGSRLRALRQECGWSVEEACLRVGCSKGYYYKLEEGRREFSVEMLVKLAQAFRLDEVDFFTFPDASPLRHSIYELLRKSPEPVLLRMKLFLLEDLERQPKAAVTSATNEEAQPARPRKRAAR